MVLKISNKSMKEYFELKIYSCKDFSDDDQISLRNEDLSPEDFSKRIENIDISGEFSERILNLLCDYDRGYFKPLTCDVYEPITEEFTCRDIKLPVRWISQLGSQLLLRRKGRYIGRLENRRVPKIWSDGFSLSNDYDDPFFLSEITFSIDKNILKEKSLGYLIDFFRFLFKEANGEYGYLATENEIEFNHEVHYVKEGVEFSEYKGLEIDDCLPGVFWLTAFGERVVNFLDIGKLINTPCNKILDCQDDLFVFKMGESPNYYKENPEFSLRVIEYFDKNFFFDRRDPDKDYQMPFANRKPDSPLI